MDFDALVEIANTTARGASCRSLRSCGVGARDLVGAVTAYVWVATSLRASPALQCRLYCKDRPRRMQHRWSAGLGLSAISSHRRFYQARGKNASDWYELDAKLKLLGHSEECLAFAAVHKVVKLTAAQRTQWQAATATLRRLLIDIEARGLEGAKALDHELYRQLVGDTCHARRVYSRMKGVLRDRGRMAVWGRYVGAPAVPKTSAPGPVDSQGEARRYASGRLHTGGAHDGGRQGQVDLGSPGAGPMTPQESRRRRGIRYLGYQIEERHDRGYSRL